MKRAISIFYYLFLFVGIASYGQNGPKVTGFAVDQQQISPAPSNYQPSQQVLDSVAVLNNYHYQASTSSLTQAQIDSVSHLPHNQSQDTGHFVPSAAQKDSIVGLNSSEIISYHANISWAQENSVVSVHIKMGSADGASDFYDKIFYLNNSNSNPPGSVIDADQNSARITFQCRRYMITKYFQITSTDANSNSSSPVKYHFE